MQLINRAFKSYMISPLEVLPLEQDSTQQLEDFARKMMRENFFFDPNFPTSPLLDTKKSCRRYKKHCNSNKSSSASSKLVQKNQPLKYSSKAFLKQTELLRLVDWIRFTACTLKLEKSYYNRAVILLKRAAKTKFSSYPLAAAALVLIIKFEHSARLKFVEQLPVGKFSPNHPIIPICQAYENQVSILKATNFSIPKDHLAQIILQVCKRWSLYLCRNSRHMHIPLKFLLTGFENEWQRRNIYSIAFLVDIILISSDAFYNSQVSGYRQSHIIIIACAILLTGATNSCTMDKINSNKYALLCFIRSFLKKCFKFSQQTFLRFQNTIAQCVNEKIWQKLRYLPTKIQQFDSSQHLLTKLTYIPMHKYQQE